MGHDLPDDAPPVRSVEPNTYDALQFIRESGTSHGIPVNILKLKISLLAQQCKKLRVRLASTDVARLRGEQTMLEEARAREQALFDVIKEVAAVETTETDKVRTILAEIAADRAVAAAELDEMGSVRAAEASRLRTYDCKFKGRKDAAAQCNDASVQTWVERVSRLPVIGVGAPTLMDRRLVNRVIVEVYLRRIDLVAKDLEKMRGGAGVVSAGDRSGGAVTHDSIFDCIMRAALEATIAPQLKVRACAARRIEQARVP